uniref:Nonstructural polyprotein n=1 Tax=Picornavirales sp. TaxID=1955153 RepID=A0A890V062_9VIRU|nr:MAG: nonstructural polyprotein [Picornavirales sp.]
MHYNIAFRKYFMGALAHIRHNRIYNGIGVGLNVWSNEWNFLAEYLTANSQTMIDGDFSNYDGTLSDQIMWEAFEVLHSLYDDGPENYTIRKNLWYYACFATRICRDKVYQCTHSLPSGFPATAEVNSIYQLIAFRCIYLKLARIHNPSVANMACFNKFVRLIIYGDDNIVSISEEIIAWFNMETIKDAFKKYLNMTYTNPQKTDEIVISKTLKDVSFLKRSFRRPTVNGYTYPMYVCPADLESRLEMLNWTRTGNIVNPKDIESDIVCEVFKELAMHGSKIYDQYVPMISKLAMQHGLKNIYDLGCETYIDSVVKNIPLKMHPNDFF